MTASGRAISDANSIWKRIDEATGLFSHSYRRQLFHFGICYANLNDGVDAKIGNFNVNDFSQFSTQYGIEQADPMKSSINFLKLVYPPVSNQCAEWLWKDKDVRKFISRSKLYMLAHRQEVLFFDYRFNKESYRFDFSLSMGNIIRTNLSVHLDDLAVCSDKEMEIEIGPQILRIWALENGERTANPLYWATTDKFLYDVWRNRFSVSGEFDVRDFTRYHLYYVGISKKNDSFSRLFENGHKNRTRILSNETQLVPTARLTDEIFIFFFDIEDLGIAQFDASDEIALPPTTPKERLVADAEKAFVKILDCKYNEEKYENYPRSEDGLYESGFDRYGFIIDEDIELVTARRSFRGVHDYFSNQSIHPDFIFTEGDSVTVIDHETSAAYSTNT